MCSGFFLVCLVLFFFLRGERWGMLSLDKVLKTSSLKLSKVIVLQNLSGFLKTLVDNTSCGPSSSHSFLTLCTKG